MSNETKKMAMPKLRFPEFRDAPEWEEEQFGEVAAFLKGKGISKADIVANGALPCIRYGELYTSYNETITSAISSTNLLADDLVLSEENDVIIPASGETQEDIATASCVLKSGIALGGDLNIIRSSLNGVFLALYLTNVKKKDIAQLAQGISVVHLYSNQLKKLSLYVPPIAEQKKIAAAFSSLQDLIDVEGKKLAALQEHKRGLMQGLFPDEGETVPKLRFPEFQDAEEWEEKRLEDVFSFRQGIQCPIENQIHTAREGYVRFIRIVDLTKTDEPQRYIADPGVAHHIRRNDLFMIRYGTPGVVGHGFEGVIANNLFRIIPKGSSTHNKFWFFAFTKMQAHLLSLSGSSTMPALNFSALNSLEVLYPNFEEQEKIADCLSSLDNRITAQTQKIEALKLHKKGLMQNLFPAAPKPIA